MLIWDQNGWRPRLTRPGVLPIFRFFVQVSVVGFFLAALLGCETFQGHDNRVQRSLENAFQQRVYYASYESVWRAAQVALKYPIALNNMDNGILETDWVRALDGYVSPATRKTASAGVRYRLQLTLVKGRTSNRDSVKVTIRKIQQRTSDFFSEAEPIQSDSLEEKVILYRIERELIIFDALRRLNNKNS